MYFPIDVREWKHAGGFSVEAAGESDNVGSLRERAREPNRGFNRFGAPAEKLRARQIPGREVGNQPNEFRARPGSEAADGDRFQLFGKRGDIARMRVPEAGHRHASVQVEIRFPVEIRERRSIPMINRQPGQ